MSLRRPKPPIKGGSAPEKEEDKYLGVFLIVAEQTQRNKIKSSTSKEMYCMFKRDTVE